MLSGATGVCDWGRTHIAVERKHTEWRSRQRHTRIPGTLTSKQPIRQSSHDMHVRLGDAHTTNKYMHMHMYNHVTAGQDHAAKRVASFRRRSMRQALQAGRAASSFFLLRHSRKARPWHRRKSSHPRAEPCHRAMHRLLVYRCWPKWSAYPTLLHSVEHRLGCHQMRRHRVVASHRQHMLSWSCLS